MDITIQIIIVIGLLAVVVLWLIFIVLNMKEKIDVMCAECEDSTRLNIVLTKNNKSGGYTATIKNFLKIIAEGKTKEDAKHNLLEALNEVYNNIK